MSFIKSTSYFLFCVTILQCCSSILYAQTKEDRTAEIPMQVNLTIGHVDQPPEHQLGRPIAVRTDALGKIYIADQGSMSIKVFDSEGTFIREIGRRGRGPGEFQDISLMDITPDEEIVVIDIMNQRYTFFSLDGEVLRSYAMRYENPFIPLSTVYIDDYVIGVQLKETELPSWDPLDRLFYAYGNDFQKGMYSFGSFTSLGYDDKFGIRSFNRRPGSIYRIFGEDCFVYSPGLYTGTFYKYCDREIEGWYLAETFNGIAPSYESPYVTYSAVETVPAGQKLPVIIHYRGEQLVGRVMSMNAGMFVLNDGRIVNFFAEWKKGENPYLNSQYVLDIDTQIFSKNGELSNHSYLLSLYRQGIPSGSPLVNWKDEDDQFYLIGTMDDIPVVQRFSLNFVK
ncbi:MAG: 6-bladed beta-propeller [Bacteroidetes bacterium]|nr:6-bladed beta-propeller [Bacteroidota bacterium]